MPRRATANRFISPNGHAIAPYGPEWGEHGSFYLPTNEIPESILRLFPESTGSVEFDPVSEQRHVILGHYGDRFGLLLLVGKKDYLHQPGLPALKVFDGIYVSIFSGG